MKNLFAVLCVGGAMLISGSALALPSSGLVNPNAQCDPSPMPIFMAFTGPFDTGGGIILPGTTANFCQHYGDVLGLLNASLLGSDPICDDPAFGSFCGLLTPCTADLNGEIIVTEPAAGDTVVSVNGNGINDTANELAMLTTILTNPSFDNGTLTYIQVLEAYEHNFYQIQCDIGPEVLLALEGALPLIAPGFSVTGLVEILAAHATIGDGDFIVDTSNPLETVSTATGSWGVAAGLVYVLCPLLDGLISPGTPPPCRNPNIVKADYMLLDTFLSADGDADGDGHTNGAEASFFTQDKCPSGSSIAISAQSETWNCPNINGITALDAMLDPNIQPISGSAALFIVANPVYPEEGDDMTMLAVSILQSINLSTAGVQWYKDFSPLATETNLTLELSNVTTADNGVYYFETDDGSKAPLVSQPYVMSVLPQGSVPVGGALAMGLLAGACALAGALGIRRKS